MKKILSILGLLLVTMVSVQAADKVPDISYDEFKAAIAKHQVVVVDVNGTESYKAGHIPGAIDYAANKDKFASVLPADKATLIVAYCANTHCGAYKQAADAAKALGYTNVKHFAPGIAGWKASKGPLEKGMTQNSKMGQGSCCSS